MIELFLVWFSLSARTPNITPNPYDYEIAYGYKTVLNLQGPIKTLRSEGKFLLERENGSEYTARMHDHGLKYLNAGEYVRTAKNISKQKFVVKYPHKYRFIKSELGAGGIWDDYSAGKFAIFSKVSIGSALTLEAAGFEKVEFFKAKLKYKYTIKDLYFIEPMGVYFSDGKTEDYQVKVKIGIQFKKKKE